jgi:hypothetical protein
MNDRDVAPRAVDPARLALGIVATAHVGALVFNESYRGLLAVAAAYATAWLVVRRAGA